MARRTRMLYRDVNDKNNEPTIPYQTGQSAYYSQHPYTAYPPVPQRTPTGNNNTPNRKPSRGMRTGAIIALAIVLAVVFGTGLFAGWQFGRTNSAVADQSTTTGALQTGNNAQSTVPALNGNNTEAVREAVIAKMRPSVVQINVATARGSGIGSGVIIDKRGYVVTNNHVVQGAQTIQVVLSNSAKLPGQLVGTDPADDLAVVKINPPANMVVATIGDSSKLRVGQEVLAIGNPLGITQTVTNGIVSALGRTVSEGNGPSIPNTIQTDAPINPGNSGGALVDMQGNLVGIPTLSAVDPEFNTPANGVGFAIPSNRVQFIATQIIDTGKVTHTGRAVLGVRVTDVDANLAAQDNLAVDHGVLITSLVSNGPAAQAGLQPGDVIVKVDNKAVNDTSSLSDVLISKSPGDVVSVQVYRGSQVVTVNVKLGEL